MLINFAPLQSVSSAAILSGLVASLCPAWPCVSLLACCTRSLELSLSGSRVLQLQLLARWGDAQALGEFAAPPVRPSLCPASLLPSLPYAPPLLPRCPPSSSTLLSSSPLPPPRPSSSSSTTTSPFQVAASFAHGHTWPRRVRMRLHRRASRVRARVSARLFSAASSSPSPFTLHEKRRYDTIFRQRDSQRDDGFLVGNVELASQAYR